MVGSLLSHGHTRNDIIVWNIRLPRAVVAIVVGASLGVAGAIMKAVTNNPLASPDLLGVSTGAAFAVVVFIVFFDGSSPMAFLWVALVGAGTAGSLVYLIGSLGTGGATPIKLALSGAVLGIFLGSMSASLLIFDLKAIDTIRLWSMGALGGKEVHAVAVPVPFALFGIAGALVLARELGTASLGTELAQAVGQNVILWRCIFGGLVIVIAGSSVALAGPIGFVGLVVPHMVRLTVDSAVLSQQRQSQTRLGLDGVDLAPRLMEGQPVGNSLVSRDRSIARAFSICSPRSESVRRWVVCMTRRRSSRLSESRLGLPRIDPEADAPGPQNQRSAHVPKT